MKYWLDTEFIEGFHKPLFGKRRHFIDLISIGIVSEDGREYYAISTEFREKDADTWVLEKVIPKLPSRHITQLSSPNAREQSRLWRTNAQIKWDLFRFFDIADEGYGRFCNDRDIEIYAYYADYDWVLFCSLFGRMIDLPEGMPMYSQDLKQTLDEFAKSAWYENALTLNEAVEKVKAYPDFPKQENEHNSLDDARWNKRLYEFLTQR